MKICGVMIDDAVLGQALADACGSVSRTGLARRVCGVLGWRDAKERLREVSCRIGLSRLAAKGLLRLPPAAAGPPRAAVRRSGDVSGQTAFTNFNGALAALGRVDLVVVQGAAMSRLWNEMMDRHHCLGSGPLTWGAVAARGAHCLAIPGGWGDGRACFSRRASRVPGKPPRPEIGPV